jgi:SAM-dependent methyltransferase
MFVVSLMTFEPAGSDGRPLVLIEVIYRWENAIRSTGRLGPCVMRKTEQYYSEYDPDYTWDRPPNDVTSSDQRKPRTPEQDASDSQQEALLEVRRTRRGLTHAEVMPIERSFEPGRETAPTSPIVSSVSVDVVASKEGNNQTYASWARTPTPIQTPANAQKDPPCGMSVHASGTLMSVRVGWAARLRRVGTQVRQRHNPGMGLAQQFGHPRGLLGAVVGRGMAKGNADLSRWVVQQAKSYADGPALRVAELGPGPGIGLEALLAQFEQAHVWGVDLSSVMLSQSRTRNHVAVAAGRLTLVEGDTSALSASQPADLVMANHVIYFWRDPAAEMSLIRGYLRPGGLLALGYQLRQNMPALAKKRFPPAGHRLYETEDELTQLATAAGFTSITHRVKGSADAPEGRVTLATA